MNAVTNIPLVLITTWHSNIYNIHPKIYLHINNSDKYIVYWKSAVKLMFQVIS